MLADNMKELRLASERFIKVEDWQNDQVIPKYVDIPAGARVYQDDIAKYCKTTKFYKAKKVVGMDKWEKTTDPNYNEKDCYLVYFNGLTKFNDLYGRVASNAPLGYFRVLASDCTPVTDVIGGGN